MLHGLVKDVAVVGIYKHVKHAGKVHKRRSSTNQVGILDVLLELKKLHNQKKSGRLQP